MKLFILFLLMSTAVFAQKESVVRQIHKTEHTVYLEIKEDSFEPNILGYACAWPGLRAPYVFEYWAKLKHGGFMGEVLALKRGDLDMQFCARPRAVDVFGPDFYVGQQIQFPVTVELLVIKKGNETFLKEIISSHLFGRDLESTAYVNLETEGEK